MIDLNRELARIHRRLLDRIWKEGTEIKVRGEDYKEITNVRFTLRFTPVETQEIQHFDIVDSVVRREIVKLTSLFGEDKNTRRMFLYFPELVMGDPPCNLIYHFLYREEKMNLNVYSRSWDILGKWRTDLFTALYSLSIFCERTGTKKGTVTFFVGSCHVPLKATLNGGHRKI